MSTTPHERYEGLKLWNEQQISAYGQSCYEAGVAAARQLCAQDALDEMVEVVGPGDEAYNLACEHIAEAIRKG